MIRSRLEGEPAALLTTWLLAGSDVASMEGLLYSARRLRCEWGTLYDPARIARAAQAFATPPLKDALAAVVRAISNKTTQKAIASRLEDLHAVTNRFLEHGQPEALLAELDALGRKTKDLFGYLLRPDRLPSVKEKPGIAPLIARIEELAEAAVPLATAVAQRFGPLIEERLQARKRAAGQFDYDDMLRARRRGAARRRAAASSRARCARARRGDDRRVPGHRSGAVADLPHASGSHPRRAAR